jgi:hypothetical protein
MHAAGSNPYFPLTVPIVVQAQEIIDEMMSSACSILQGLQQQIIVEAEVARL